MKRRRLVLRRELVAHLLARDLLEVRAGAACSDTCGVCDSLWLTCVGNTLHGGAVMVSLAEQVHAAHRAVSSVEESLLRAVTAACGQLACGDAEEWTTDQYDNSIEVFGVGGIDLDAAASKLKESGFDRVWLHQHPPPPGGGCRCPCR